jgi:acyl-CoA thioesterase YciA
MMPPFSSTDPAIRVTAMPADTNANGDIFGGWLMGQMDMGAGFVAARVARGRVVTVAMDGMQFHLPVMVGDEVSVYCQTTKVGRSSITISTEAWRRHRFEEDAVKVTEAVFTFVAIDDNGKPRPVHSATVAQEK